VIDYNGDGRADLLFRSGANWNVLQSTGSGFTNVSTGLTTSDMQNPSVLDLDGDGLSDVVYAVDET
jgi:Tfp pilus tip-associated adhesin PilY1